MGRHEAIYFCQSRRRCAICHNLTQQIRNGKIVFLSDLFPKKLCYEFLRSFFHFFLRRLMTVETLDWTIDDAIATYNVDRWGLGYFSVNEEGNVTVSPLREKGATIDLMQVLSEIPDRGLQFPLVLRFQDLL